MIITEYNEEWDKEAQLKYYTERAFERGRTEANLRTARNLLTMNLPLEKISRAVGLPEEEILKLSKE